MLPCERREVFGGEIEDVEKVSYSLQLDRRADIEEGIVAGLALRATFSGQDGPTNLTLT